jgi:hypothetical protein
MMNSNNMDAAQHQKSMQMQQLASNAGQQAITNETQGRVAMEGAQRVAGLSAAQKTNDLFRTSEALMLTAMNSGEKLKEMADPNVAADRLNSLREQKRLKGMMA